MEVALIALRDSDGAIDHQKIGDRCGLVIQLAWVKQ